MSAVYKSRKMLEAEEVLGCPLEDCLDKLVTELGQTEVANRLGIGNSLLRHWLKMLNVSMYKVAVGQNDVMTIERAEYSDSSIARGREEYKQGVRTVVQCGDM